MSIKLDFKALGIELSKPLNIGTIKSVTEDGKTVQLSFSGITVPLNIIEGNADEARILLGKDVTINQDGVIEEKVVKPKDTGAASSAKSGCARPVSFNKLI